MIEYTTSIIARSEHEQMKQSLLPVTEFDGRSYVNQPGNAVTRLGKLYQAIVNVAVSIQRSPSHELKRTLDESIGQPHACNERKSTV